MAGQPRSRAAATKGLETHKSAKAKAKRRRNKRLLRELIAVAEPWSFEPPTGVGNAELWDELLGHAVAFMRFAHEQATGLERDQFWVYKVDAQGNMLIEPHAWIQYAQATRAEVMEIKARMEQLGIDAKRLELNEATAEAFVNFFNTVVEQLKLTGEQRKTLIAAMRSYKEAGVIEGRLAA